MPLLAFWASSPDAVDQLTIEQIVASAGDGILKDASGCSIELRKFLSQIPTGKLAQYVEQCLGSPLPKGGLVLQDLVNELGRRLDYEVKDGLYQGVVGGIGFDGIWMSPEGHSVVAEVKTTDAYRMSLDTLASYRRKLIDRGDITIESSILIVVGRQDTGELEAQIRGSRHAWDIRLISAEAMLKLVLLKENAEAQTLGGKIRGLLRPVEYTRLDRLADAMFDTVADVEESPEEPSAEGKALSPDDAEGHFSTAKWEFTNSADLQAKRVLIIAALEQREDTELKRKSRALYASSDQRVRVACGMSKRYVGKNQNIYWYAFHPQWDDFLDVCEKGLFVLGCMDKNEAYAIPHAMIKALLPSLNTTTKDGVTYWHIHLREELGKTLLVVPKGDNQDLSFASFKIS